MSRQYGYLDTYTGEFVQANNGGGNYNRGNNRGYNSNNNGQRKKHSGAKTGINQKGSMKGKPHIVAWNFSRDRGLISLIATPYKGTDKHKSKTSGRVWENWMVSWRNKRTMEEGVTSGLYDTTTGKLIINAWGWVVNPKAPNGGYCGKYTRSK